MATAATPQFHNSKASAAEGPNYPTYEPTVYVRFAKPTIDVTAGVVLAILTLPLLLLVAVIILLTLGRPVFYLQERVGRGGHTFRIFKFRTMLSESDNPTLTDEQRHTRAGLLLRGLSLDELPQFWNVIRGEMSLVGPRPEVKRLADEHYHPWQHRRHVLKPGITGLWQVLERDDHQDMWRDTEIDVAYVHRVSLWTDLVVLTCTPLAAIGRRRPHLFGIQPSKLRDLRPEATSVLHDQQVDGAEEVRATA